MRLRTRLILAFLVLSVVPLAAIVLYSYLSSIEAFRRAVLAETTEMAADMETRMRQVREDLSRRLKRLGDLPLGELAAAGSSPQVLAQIADALGDTAPYLEALELIPGPAPAPAAPPDVAPSGRAAAVPSPGDLAAIAPEGVVIFLPELAAAMAAPPGAPAPFAGAASTPASPAVGPVPAAPGLAGLDLAAVGRLADAAIAALGAEGARGAAQRGLSRELQRLRREASAEWAEKLAAALEESRVLSGKGMRLGLALQAVPIVRDRRQLDPATQQALSEGRARTKKLLGREFGCEVEADGRRVGSIRAQLASEAVLRMVLALTRRDQGEIPFAVDAEGQLYVAAAEDESRLEGVPVFASLRGEAPAAAREPADDNWVVVKTRDPESGLVYGIARPIRQSLAEIRATAGRNFAAGLGLIAVALVGIAPLSGRMTRDLRSLAGGAERLAEGDLDVEVPVRSPDEIGQLAATFNRMARQLKEHQARLLEEERLRKARELAQSLLEAENRRKSAELEEARRFQLSLLPHELPHRPGLEIAVRMRTATEVGGDYYDFRDEPGGALTVAIGDATGHGAKAGIMVTALKSLFTAHAADGGLAEFLGRSTQAIKRMGLARMAMALALVRLDGRRLAVASAGMPPVLVHRAAGGGVEEVGLGGLPLGSLADCGYREAACELATGDTVLLMSDGFPELQNPQGEPLGYPRARAAFARAAASEPAEVIDRLFAQVEAWAGRETPSDDVTFVVLRVRGDLC